MVLVGLTWAALMVLAGGEGAPRAEGANAALAPAVPGTPAPPVEVEPAPGPQDAAGAAAAVRATQDLEAKLIELSNQLAGLEKQRASWEDIRLRLDQLGTQVDGLSRQLEAARAATPASPYPGAPGPMDSVRRGGLLVVSTPDDSFLLRPTLRLQAGYQGQLVSLGPGQLVAPDSSTFLLRRAEVMLEGHVFQRLIEYRLQLDFVAPQVVKDAFVQWRVSPCLAVRIGQFKIPYGFERYILSAYYEFVGASEAAKAFSLGRDIGAMVVGRQFGGKLQYQASVTNGAGPGRLNDNLDLAYALRMVAAPFGPLPEEEGDIAGQPRPLVSMGGAAYYNLLPTDVRARTGDPTANQDVDGDGRIDNVAVWQGALQLRAMWRGAALQAEYYQRLEHPGGAAADRDSHGEYAQASYFVIPHFLQVAARLGRTAEPLYGAPLAVRQAIGTSVDEQAGAISAYIRRQALKIQLDYTHLRAENVSAPGGFYTPDTQRVRAQVQLMF